MTENDGFEKEPEASGSLGLVPNLSRLKLWADDLITTTAKQGQGHLRYGDEYCCLGRAVEVAMANGCEVEVTQTGRDGLCYKYNGVTDFLPRVVADWYGLPLNPPIVPADEKELTCDADCPCCNIALKATEANDEQDWTFKQIGEALIAYYGLKRDADG